MILPQWPKPLPTWTQACAHQQSMWRAGQEVASAEYWVKHVRGAVRFFDGLQAATAGGATFIEVGPSPVLSGVGLQSVDDRGLGWIPSMRKKRSEWATLMQALGLVHGRGVSVDWCALLGTQSRPVMPLPTYAFQRERYWVETPKYLGASLPGQFEAQSDLGGIYFAQPNGGWQHFISIGPSHQNYLKDHIIHGRLIAAGAFHLGVALAIGEEHWGRQGFAIEQVQFMRPLIVDQDQTLVVQISPTKKTDAFAFRVMSMGEEEGEWFIYVEGTYVVGAEPERFAGTLAEAKENSVVDVPTHYEQLALVKIV